MKLLSATLSLLCLVSLGVLTGCQTDDGLADAKATTCPYCNTASEAQRIEHVAYNKTVCPMCERTASNMWTYEHRPAQVHACAHCETNIAVCPDCQAKMKK